jgi:hypothetical protein
VWSSTWKAVWRSRYGSSSRRAAASAYQARIASTKRSRCTASSAGVQVPRLAPSHAAKSPSSCPGHAGSGPGAAAASDAWPSSADTRTAASSNSAQAARSSRPAGRRSARRTARGRAARARTRCPRVGRADPWVPADDLDVGLCLELRVELTHLRRGGIAARSERASRLPRPPPWRLVRDLASPPRRRPSACPRRLFDEHPKLDVIGSS